jgi:hypothetical protein
MCTCSAPFAGTDAVHPAGQRSPAAGPARGPTPPHRSSPPPPSPRALPPPSPRAVEVLLLEAMATVQAAAERRPLGPARRQAMRAGAVAAATVRHLLDKGRESRNLVLANLPSVQSQFRLDRAQQASGTTRQRLRTGQWIASDRQAIKPQIFAGRFRHALEGAPHRPERASSTTAAPREAGSKAGSPSAQVQTAARRSSAGARGAGRGGAWADGSEPHSENAQEQLAFE